MTAVGGAPRRLYRDTRNGMLGGVLAGIAEFFGLDPTLVRVGYVLVSVLTAAFPGIVVYLLLWIIVPRRPDDP